MVGFKLLLIASAYIILNIESGADAADWKPFEFGNYTYIKTGKPHTCVLGELIDPKDGIFDVSRHGPDSKVESTDLYILAVAEPGKQPKEPDAAQMHRMKVVGVKVIKKVENTKGTLISQKGDITKENIPGRLFQNAKDLAEKTENDGKAASKASSKSSSKSAKK